MKKLLNFLIAAGAMCSAFAQSNTKDVVVRAWAEISNGTPPTITLKWNMFASTQPISIYKKSINDVNWTFVASVAATDTSYVTKRPRNGVATEWRIQKDIYINNQLNNYCNGYVYAGVKVDEVHSRGDLLMVISKAANDSLSTDIGNAIQDMRGDGWNVDSIVIGNTSTHLDVKARIRSWYNANSNARSIFLFGHIPVPYSGNMRNGGTSIIPADGHSPQHDGAWPSDAWYADMDTLYTDIATNSTGDRAANRNAPGDGKFDQIVLPSNVELEIARVDLSSLPAFAKTEMQLLQQYLQKLHAYKTAAWNIPRRGLIDDRLGYLSAEAPGRGAWHSLSPAFRPSNITEGDYYTTLKSNAYLVAHEAGFGNYSQYVNIMNTSNYNDSIKSVFNSSFGSYFGDWDNSDNILRGCLASPGYTLTNCWNGRPMFLFHHMALGLNIGHSVKTTQNNFTILGVKNITYPILYMSGRTHISMMGDPTLRMHSVIPVSNVTVKARKPGNPGLRIRWAASTDSNIVGYNIYRADNEDGPFTLLNTKRVKKLTLVDSNPPDGLNVYMVRAVKLDSSASGTYFNMSIGVFKSANYVDTFNISAPRTEEEGNVFADGELENAGIKIYPNPASGLIYLELSDAFRYGGYRIANVQGKSIASAACNGNARITLNASGIPEGIYFITFTSRKHTHTAKIVIVK